MKFTRAARVRVLVAVVGAVLLMGVRPLTAQAGIDTYVSLGDSYTAGPLIPNQLTDPPGCQRSDHNYPHRVARTRGSILRDPSCSGATTRDLSAPQTTNLGVNPAQLDRLDARVTVVSLQIGGNDIGFSEILQRCAAPIPLGTPCRNVYAPGSVDEISRRIDATAPKVAAALAETARRAPRARTFVVGYPAILPETAWGCWPTMPVAPGDVAYLRDKEKELNAMLAAEAAAAGATYVDLYGPSIGHDACQLPGFRWVEPYVPLAPAAPVHPNALGMQRMARVVAGAMTR